MSGLISIVGAIGVSDVAGLSVSSASGEEPSTRSKKNSVSQPSVCCYTVEDLLVKIFSSTYNIECASKDKHGLQLTKYAPDLMFADQYCTMTLSDMTLDKTLGLGAFGVVFKGTLKRSSHHSRGAVAVKTMQPYNPGAEVDEKYKNHFEAEEKAWKMDPHRKAFTSYSDARQEINILNLIQDPHIHIVKLVGVLLQPLSIVMECAPLGSLQNTIEEYSRNGVKIPLTILQLIIQQVASALSYLHSDSIKLIYRDLKADNVLVWLMPAPMRKQQAADQRVEVRLADFGVSTVSDRTSRGNWGTPGYMAPEIILFSGKEEYTNKVDCYSFGSFIYELITLNRPFHSADGNINNLVIAGKRPPISSKELSYPTNLLDLMSGCWEAEAKDRPSADEILHIASDPDFISLQEAVRSESAIEYVTASCIHTKTVALDMSTSFMDVSFDARGPAGYDIYIVGGAKTDRDWSGRVDKLSYGSHGQFVSAQSCDLDVISPLIQACCTVGSSHCWVGDADGYIHVINTDTEGNMSIVNRFLAAPPYADTPSPTVGQPPCPLTPSTPTVPCGRIRQLLYIEESERVYCLLNKGTLIEYDSNTYTKLSSRRISTNLDCNCMLLVNDRLWIGQRDAYISIIPIHDLINESQSVSDWMSSDNCYTCTVNHFSPVEQYIDTTFLVTDTERHTVWSYVYPGSSIFQWDVGTPSVNKQIDLKETLKTHHASNTKSSYQVADLAFHQSNLIAATTCGVVVLLDASTLEMVMHMSPHATATYRTLYSIIPLTDSQKFLTVGVGYRNSDSEKVRSEDKNKKPPIHLLSWYSNPSLSL